MNAESAKLSLQKSENKVGENAAVGIYLVGAGVVGSAILQSHLDAGISVWLADQDEDAVRDAVQRVRFSDGDWGLSGIRKISGSMSAIHFHHRDAHQACQKTLVIESIVEKLDVKQAFFREAEQIFGDDALLCTNTSTLPIGRIAESLDHPGRFSGMHFFMPVAERPAVELIAGSETQAATTEACIGHVERIGKEPLVVGDGPAFVVNRLLSPYLNEAMLLLCRGVSAARIENAALGYGMPMSPLELIDWIGMSTMFDAGRAFWQAFPKRLDPAPLLVAMIKSKRFGRAADAGFYDYVGGRRSAGLAVRPLELCQEYGTAEWVLEDEQIRDLLAIPMWVEAACAFKDGIVSNHHSFDLAMGGGLGYEHQRSWHGYFDSLGSDHILRAVETWAGHTRAMHAPLALRKLLRTHNATQALVKYAEA